MRSLIFVGASSTQGGVGELRSLTMLHSPFKWQYAEKYILLQIISQSLQSGILVTLGGSVIESILSARFQHDHMPTTCITILGIEIQY